VTLCSLVAFSSVSRGDPQSAFIYSEEGSCKFLPKCGTNVFFFSLHGFASQKAAELIVTTVRVSCLAE
jgi:hypothetical protein